MVRCAQETLYVSDWGRPADALQHCATSASGRSAHPGHTQRTNPPTTRPKQRTDPPTLHPPSSLSSPDSRRPNVPSVRPLLSPRILPPPASFRFAARWQGNFQDDLNAMLCVWVPLHFLNFRFVPLYLRMPFMSAAGLIWVFVLSVTRGDEIEATAQECDNVLSFDAQSSGPVDEVGEEVVAAGPEVKPNVPSVACAATIAAGAAGATLDPASPPVTPALRRT